MVKPDKKTDTTVTLTLPLKKQNGTELKQILPPFADNAADGNIDLSNPMTLVLPAMTDIRYGFVILTLRNAEATDPNVSDMALIVPGSPSRVVVTNNDRPPFTAGQRARIESLLWVTSENAWVSGPASIVYSLVEKDG